MIESFSTFAAQLDPKLQELIALGITALVSYLILQLANLYPALAEYLGQYKVAIVTWLTGLVVQLLQAALDKVPVTWDAVAVLAMQLIAQVIIVLLGFALIRRKQAKGYKALLPS